MLTGSECKTGTKSAEPELRLVSKDVTVSEELQPGERPFCLAVATILSRKLRVQSPIGVSNDGKTYMPVNSKTVQTSTRVMAACTALEPMIKPSADEIAAQDFDSVVASHRAQIFRFLLASTRDVDLAETLTQDCFLKAHRNWSSFRGESSVMTWLMRIAINLQKDHWRNRRLQFWRHTRTNSVDADEASEWLPSGERTAEQRMLAKEQVSHVWKAVDKLSDRQRTVFLLRFVEELELKEIAEATGMGEGTVKAHLSRALARVRKELLKEQGLGTRD